MMLFDYLNTQTSRLKGQILGVYSIMTVGRDYFLGRGLILS